MRLLAAAGLALALALPGPAVAATWTGTWVNAAMGTAGTARLTTAKQATLRLDGLAFGCATPVTLAVKVKGDRITGAGADPSCNRGLHWKLTGRLGDAAIDLRLTDGSTAELQLVLRRHG